MYKAIVNGKDFEIVPSDEGFMVNGQPLNWDKVKIADGYFHIFIQDKSYRTEVVRIDPLAKAVTLKINGHTYLVEVKDKFDLLLEKLGMNTSAGSKINNIKAPMPGLIIDLKVQAGSTVKAGDALLILEAMKMENIIKSSGEGIVKHVKVKKGDSVEKGEVLIEF